MGCRICQLANITAPKPTHQDPSLPQDKSVVWTATVPFVMLNGSEAS